jgi:hypothetical protein
MKTVTQPLTPATQDAQPDTHVSRRALYRTPRRNRQQVGQASPAPAHPPVAVPPQDPPATRASAIPYLLGPAATPPDVSKFEVITTDKVAERLGYAKRTIRNTWIDVVLFENVHFIKPRRKYLFLWENIVRDLPYMGQCGTLIPMANGGYARG